MSPKLMEWKARQYSRLLGELSKARAHIAYLEWMLDKHGIEFRPKESES